DILGAGFEYEVHYYISACDTLGICSTLPESWPLEFFGFYVGTDTIAPVIHHRPLKDAAPEAAPYEVKFVVEDNLGVDKCLVIWSFNHGSPETLVTIPDSIGECLTYLEPEFIDTGDNIEYRIEAIDGAIISNITLLPVVGNFSFSIVRSIWVDFESDDGEFISPRGWQWGIPREDVGAYSGSKCWGTMLTGDYSNNADYILKTDDFDVIGWNSGTMEMWSFWAAERPFDGGHLRISSDGGVRWYDIEPIGGYPSSMVAASGHAGFSGYSDSWEKVIFDLTPFMSGGFDLISFEFIFKSDDGANGPGWYIDDLALLEKQIVLSPGNLIAESGYNIHIPLNWASPDPSSGTTIRFRPASFDGYNIYRALSPDDFTMTPINPHPIIDTFYTDTDVANEIPYYYRVTALYHDEESLPTAIAEAMPFNAIASIEPDSVALVLTYGSEPFDTHLSIANIGSGGLEFEISEFNSEPETRECGSVSSDFGRRIMDVLRHMNEGSAFDDLIVDAMTSPSPDDWRFLLRDPDEPSTDKDIRDIWGQHDGANVWFKFDSWSYMGDPEEDFAAGFGIDIDMDPSTGSPDFMGVEYLVAVGAIPLPTPGVILKYAPSSSYGWDLAGTPHWIMANGDSAGVGFTKAQIEDPSSIYIYAAIITEFTGVPVFEDQAPNPGSSPILYLLSDAWWLDESPISSVVSSEAPQSVNLHVDVPSISIGEYRAWLGITTNDRANPSKVIPVYCRIVPVGISEIDKPLTLSLGKPFPNPFNSACRFEFSTPEGYVEIKVFDIAGRRIRELFSGDVSAGKYGTVWDGTDEAGKPLPTGVYNLSISIGESTETAKILLVK
ncbi:hypothetical protein KAH81_07950, partial [bacterium]|nr:hypothetical protein [bacterium]